MFAANRKEKKAEKRGPEGLENKSMSFSPSLENIMYISFFELSYDFLYYKKCTRKM